MNLDFLLLTAALTFTINLIAIAAVAVGGTAALLVSIPCLLGITAIGFSMSSNNHLEHSTSKKPTSPTHAQMFQPAKNQPRPHKRAYGQIYR